MDEVELFERAVDAVSVSMVADPFGRWRLVLSWRLSGRPWQPDCREHYELLSAVEATQVLSDVLDSILRL